MNVQLAALVLVPTLAMVQSCREPDPSSEAPTLSTRAPTLLRAEQADALWTVRCASCHGENGIGDTPIGQLMSVPDMTLPRWQRSISDAAIKDSIRRGMRRTRDGRFTNMPPFPDLTDTQLDSLVGVVRGKGG